MPQNKTLSTGILVPDFLNEAVRVNVANLELGNSQTVTVEVLNWGVDTFGWLATSDPTPMQVQPSSPVMIGPDSQQSFLVQLLGPPKPLYEVRVTIPRDQHLVITCCALDNSLRVIAGNTVWHEELVEVGSATAWAETETFVPGCFLTSDPWQNRLFDWDTLAQSKVRFLTHCPVDKEFIDRCHALGILCFPYVVFYMGSKQATFGSLVSDTYEGVRWADHEDWYERDQSGKTRYWQFTSTTPDGVGVKFSDPLLVCPNVEEYQRAMVAWVSYVMDQRADGVFVDVLEGREPCWGEQLGFHKHVVPDDPSNFPKAASDPSANQNKAFALLLKKTRDVVKQRRADSFVWGNSGNPLDLPTPSALTEFQQYIDGDTVEAYICQPDANGNIVQTKTWEGDPNLTWDQLGRKLQAYLGTGKRILVISNLGSKKGVREDAFLCYASARLAGLTWYGLVSPSEISVSVHSTADLYRLHLGEALTSDLTDSVSGVNFRVFERGLVAVNWSQTDASLTVTSPPIPVTRFYNLFEYDSFPLTPSKPNIEVPLGGTLTIPAMSGRVYLFGSSTDYGLNRLI